MMRIGMRNRFDMDPGWKNSDPGWTPGSATLISDRSLEKKSWISWN